MSKEFAGKVTYSERTLSKHPRYEKPIDFEHFSDESKICGHLMRTNRGELCVDFERRFPARIEGALVEDIATEYAKEVVDMEKIDALRGHVYFVSYFSYPPTSPEAIAALLPTLDAAIHDRKRHMEQAGLSKEDVQERLQELRRNNQRIQEAVASGVCGPSNEEAVRGMEDFFGSAWHELSNIMRMKKISWRQVETWRDEEKLGLRPKDKNGRRIVELVKQMETWRPLRDRLYYQRLYLHWCELATANKAKKK